jgi:hypothetical protein
LIKRREVLESVAQALVLTAPEEEVVAQRKQHVDVGLLDEPAQQGGEARLHLGSVQGEQLLELVHDNERLAALLSPAPDSGEHAIRLPAQAQLLHPLQQLADHLGVAGELEGERAGERQGRAGAGSRVGDGPSPASTRPRGASSRG